MRFSFASVSLFVLILYLCNYIEVIHATFWDGVVGVSQIKQAAQWFSGDKKGARQTHRNFWNQMPVASQLKSIGQVIIGDGAGAQDTQLKFLAETVEPVLENTPVIGHIKAYVHVLLGNEAYGYKVMRSATISSMMVLIASVSGPFGALAAGLGSEAFLTLAESAVRRKYTPVGFFNYLENIKRVKAGEHVEQLADLLGTLYGGRKIKASGVYVTFICDKYKCVTKYFSVRQFM